MSEHLSGQTGRHRAPVPESVPRSGAMWPPPPEVVTDYHRCQVLAVRENGMSFAQYAPCSEGCGWVIGCGDAIDTIAHESCLEARRG